MISVCLVARSADRDFEKYKGHSQVTIFDSTMTFMEESGLSHTTSHRMVKILNHIGARDNSVVKVDFDPLSAYVEIRKICIHRAGGDVENVRINPYVYIAPARMIYWGASQKMVEVGHLDPGDTLEITTYRKGFTYALLLDDSRYVPPMKGHFYDIVPFWSDQPVKHKVYSVNVLKSKNLQYRVYNGGVESSISYDNQNSRAIYTFERKDIMPLKGEPNMLAKNDIEPKLLLSTSPDWEAKSMWFYGVNEDYGSFNTTPELRKKVKELLRGAKSELDSISELTHWVADNMRYSGISMGEGEGYTLHNATMNFTDRCGVCKDKASLLIAMLRTAGFEAYAAMTMAGERIDRIPADQFNHSVTVVKRRNGEYQLLDPTWVPNVRELWSSAEQQQGYLMGLPQGADLQETPVSAPENHYLKIYGKSELNSNGSLAGEFTVTAEGQSDANVRSIFSCRRSEWQRNVEAELLRVAPNAEIISVTYTDNDTYLKQPVKITYKYRIPDYATASGKTMIFTPLLAKRIFARAMPNLSTSIETREYPFKDRCSRLIDIEETVTLPAGFNVQNNFSNDEMKSESGALSYTGGFSQNGNKLIFKQTASFGKRVYDAGEWPAFRDILLKMNSNAHTSVILSKDNKK